MHYIINYAAILFGITALLWIILSNTGGIRKIIFGSVSGCAALLLVRHFLPQICVGINAVTCLFCGIFGIPGFFTLFIVKLLL